MASAQAPTDVAAQSTPRVPASNSSKKRNNKKKKNANNPKPTIDSDKFSGQAPENDDLTDEPETPPVLNGSTQQENDAFSDAAKPEVNNTHANGDGIGNINGHAVPNTTNAHVIIASSRSLPPETSASTTTSGSTAAKLEAMSQEREALRAEVEGLRKQLESLQETHGQEEARLKKELEESEAAREEAELQYETLMGRVEKIKTTLGDRLKSDKAELEAAKDRVEELEARNEELAQARQDAEAERAKLRDETAEQSRELASLRSRNHLSQQNWLKEKEDLTRQMQHMRSELESTSGAMGEWEVIAMEERSLRESLTDKVADLEEQITSVRDAYERATVDRDTQAQAVDGLQRALGEIQEARKKELREMVETSEEQLQAMKRRLRDADARVEETEAAREALSKELERTAPFEREVKEKNLLIGKLRHEAIVLNDHLTKALKYIKKTKPEETIDRQIVTNHFLQFLTLDRSDPRKFQILQVIAGLLNWTDEQREQAGLARPGAALHHNLRLPASPFHRKPSSSALNSEFFAESTSSASAAGKESLTELWQGFLERSVEEASAVGGGTASRKDSMSSVATSVTNRPDTREGHN